MRRALIGLAASVALVLGGCGDDDLTPTGDGGSDAGPVIDAGGSDAGGMDAGMDAGTDAGNPVETCDPGVEDSCAEGEKCAVAVATVDEEVVVFFACVPSDTGEKGPGLVCSRGVDATPDDSEDDITTDNCGQGLFCWREQGESLARCQPLCRNESGDCEETEFCRALNSTPFFGTCKDADDCDPVFQTGCSEGDACYVVSTTEGDPIGTCFEFSVPDGGTGAPDEECSFIDTCQPGTQCLGAPLPDGGVTDDTRCRVLCNADPADGGVADGGALDAGPADAGPADAGEPMDAAVADAGDPMDGGVPLTGECESPATCTALPLLDGAVIRTPTAPAACF